VDAALRLSEGLLGALYRAEQTLSGCDLLIDFQQRSVLAPFTQHRLGKWRQQQASKKDQKRRQETAETIELLNHRRSFYRYGYVAELGEPSGSRTFIYSLFSISVLRRVVRALQWP